MKKVQSAYCLVDTERCADLDDLLGRMAEGDHRYTYSVAWIDCLAGGSSLGRSVLTRGWAATVEQLPRRLRGHALDFRPKQLAVAPSGIPSGLLNRTTVAAFNEVWYRKSPRERRGEIQSIAAFFHPLDGVGQWNRIYGRKGFLQYQFVVPFGAEETLRRCIQMLSDTGQASFLAVLKRFGPASGKDLLVQSVEQPAQDARTDRHVESQGPARRGKRQMTAAGRSKPLEDRQERGLTGVAEHLDALAQRLLGAEGNDELVLEEALAPVDAVPLSDAVERVEERRDALDLASALSRGLAVPHLVEGGDGCAVQQAARNSRRRDCQLLGPEVQGMATQPVSYTHLTLPT